MNKHSRLPLALALALGSGQVLALGLGQIQVKSALNQPLEAEIELLSATPAEIENLRVQLASSRDAERVGMSATGPFANLQFSVGRSGGKPVIKVTTPDRVTAPFLSFMLDVSWGKGRLLREYTVLLDPPRTAPAVARTQAATTPVREPTRAPTQTVAAPAASASAAPAPAPTRPPVAPPPSAMQAAPGTSASPSSAADQYGPVASGETLWTIAQQVRPDTALSHNQVMMALLRANPDAFIGNNINRLKRGAVLRIPTRADIEALAAAEAAAQVRGQMQSWRGEATATTPQPAEPRAAAVERAAPARTPAAEPRLRISPPASGETQSAESGAAEGAAGTAEMRAQLTQSREELASRTREVSELRERVAELEKIQGDGERLLALKDSELAALQSRLRELEGQAAGTPATSADSSTAAAQPTADATSATDAATPDGAAAPLQTASPDPSETAAPTTGSEAPPRTRARPAATPSQPATATPPVPAPAPVPTPAWYENLYILGGLGALVLGLLGLLALRRRSTGAASAPAGGNGSRRYDSEAVLASMTANAAATAASEAEEASMDREAELLDAVAESPTDLSRHLELVQHYYAQSDAEAFEGSAEAMYAQLDDAEDMRWKQVLAMGREFLPDHPLFSPPSQRAEMASQEAARIDLHDDEPVTQRSSFESRPLSTPVAQADELESLDFGSESDFESPAVSYPAAPELAEPEPERIEALPVAEPEPDFLNDGDDDSSATKLELARAYLDMGDVEGARAMLEEVAGEGNPGQRSEAKRLLDEIR